MIACYLHNKSQPIKMIGLFSEMSNECWISELDILDNCSTIGMPETTTVVVTLEVGVHTQL